MDDICLTRCEGTSFDEPTDLSVSGGMAVNEPSMALQGALLPIIAFGQITGAIRPDVGAGALYPVLF